MVAPWLCIHVRSVIYQITILADKWYIFIVFKYYDIEKRKMDLILSLKLIRL